VHDAFALPFKQTGHFVDLFLDFFFSSFSPFSSFSSSLFSSTTFSGIFCFFSIENLNLFCLNQLVTKWIFFSMPFPDLFHFFLVLDETDRLRPFLLGNLILLLYFRQLFLEPFVFFFQLKILFCFV